MAYVIVGIVAFAVSILVADAIISWGERRKRATASRREGFPARCSATPQINVEVHRATRQLQVREERLVSESAANRAIAELAYEIAIKRELDRRGRS